MRIVSVENIKKITQARQMISSTHLHRSQSLLEAARAYNQRLDSLAATLYYSDNMQPSSPLAQQRDAGAVVLIAIASNSSMCGTFNSRMIKETLDVARKYEGQELLIFPIGEKLRRAVVEAGYVPQGKYDYLSGKTTYAEAVKLVEDLIQRFVLGRVKEVLMLHYHYRNMLTQNIVHQPLLPCAAPGADAAREHLDPDSHILEPSHEALCNDVVQQALKAKFYAALLDTHTSEHAARTMTMQMANDNANEMLDDLHLNYNKLRQQNITAELLDIVAGTFA